MCTIFKFRGALVLVALMLVGTLHTAWAQTNVASITDGGNTTYYQTLSAAISAATSGQTIKLLTDCNETTFILEDGVTLDTDGHKITTTEGWTLAAGSVTNTNALTNAYSGEQSPKTGAVRGAIYASTGTLDLRGTNLWVYDTAKMSGGDKDALKNLDTLKATMLYYGWTQGPAPEATTIKNIVLDQYTAGQRGALGVYDGTLTVDKISVDDSNPDWYKSPESNFQVYTGGYKLNGTMSEGGTLVVNTSLTTAGFLNASSWIYGAGKTILNEGAVLNAYDFQNRGRLRETAKVKGEKATVNAVMFTNSAYTELGTINLTGYDHTTTYTNSDPYIASTGTWDKTKYEGYGGYNEAYTKIGQLNVTEDKKYTFRSSDGSETHIGGINSAATNGLDYYVTDAATVSINEDGSKAVQLNGDIVFASYSNGTSDDANFSLNLSTSDSYFTGSVKGTVSQSAKPTSWAGNPVMGDEVASYEHITGMTISISNGAVWNITENSSVNDITVSEGGRVAMDFSSQIKTSTITNSGVISIDMTGATAKFYKLIDASTASTYGTEGTNYKFADNKDNGYEFTIVDKDLCAVKMGSFEVTVGESGFATIYSNCNLIVPAGVTVTSYGRITADNAENITIFVAGDIIKGGQGYVISAKEGTYTFNETKANPTEDVDSCLEGVTEETDQEVGETYYVFDVQNGKPGFYKYDTGKKLQPNKAYYQPVN